MSLESRFFRTMGSNFGIKGSEIGKLTLFHSRMVVLVHNELFDGVVPVHVEDLQDEERERKGAAAEAAEENIVQN